MASMREHFRAAVVDLGRSRRRCCAASFSSRSRRRWASARRISYCLFSASSVSQRRFGRGKLGFGLGGELGQTLHFRRGFGHFRLGLDDGGVQLAVVDLGDHVALLDEIRLGHVQPGEPSGELGGEHRLPVGDDIAGGGQLGAAVHRFARRGGNPDGGRDADFHDLQPRSSRGDRTATATMATRTTHTQGDTRRRRRDRSIFSAAKPSEDIFAAPHCTPSRPSQSGVIVLVRREKIRTPCQPKLARNPGER